MNRRERRATARDPRSAGRIIELQHRVEATGRPGVIHGLTDACRDCRGGGAILLMPGGKAIGYVDHDAGCPVAGGVVEWQPAP